MDQHCFLFTQTHRYSNTRHACSSTGRSRGTKLDRGAKPRGQVVEVSWFIQTSHIGRCSVQLCRAAAASEAECSAPLMR